MQSTLHRIYVASAVSQTFPHLALGYSLRRTQLSLNNSATRIHCSAAQRLHRKLSTEASSIEEQWNHGKLQNTSADTIYALSTPPGRAAIAVIRISGAACPQIYRSLCPGKRLPRPRIATVRRLQRPGSPTEVERVLDSAALVLYFPAPNTVTGQDVLEFHTHGGPAIVKAVLKAIPSCTAAGNERSEPWNIRYAEPGEFTKRAFYNDRLDLTQVEALSDSLFAETEQQRRLAVQGTGGGLAARYDNWRNLLLCARAELEALIDFSEDQEFEESAEQLLSSVLEQVMGLKRDITLHVENASKGELLRNGISIALVGAPNAGKSSLLNIIVGREAAIVSAKEGTTRDIVDVSVDIGGWLCRLGDMAGLRNGTLTRHSESSSGAVDPVEEEGIRRAKARASASDVVIVILSLEVPGDTTAPSLYVDPEVIGTVRECEAAGKPLIVAVNKTDHLQAELTEESRMKLYGEVTRLFPFVPEKHIFAISCLQASMQAVADGDPGNIQGFLRGLQSLFSSMTAVAGTIEQATGNSYWEESLSVTHRQSEHLRQCLGHVTKFISYTKSQRWSDCREHAVSELDLAATAEHLRFAGDCLSKITGKGTGGEVEEVLGVVFEKFCVGK